MSLTSLKDVDREVLKFVDDKDLLKICGLNRKTWNEICNDDFLRRRILSKYPGIDKYKRENETWKQFFLSAIYYISKMKEEKGFQYTDGDFKKQYHLLRYNDNLLLIYSSREGELSLVKHSIQQGADLHALENYPVRLASKHGQLNVVKYLTEHGADIHTEDEDALIAASQNGHLEVVKFLVEQGADIHAQDDEALKLAIENGYPEIVKYLKNLN
jgi:hypothetical protein